MRRAAVLLELIVSLALFVAAGMAVLTVTRHAVGSIERTRLQQRAGDHARSAMALLEVGLASPESLDGSAPTWLDRGEFDESAPVSPWTIEVETEPSAYTDLTLVTVTAVHEPTPGTRDASFTLRQLIRLARLEEDTIGEEDKLVEQAERGAR